MKTESHTPMKRKRHPKDKHYLQIAAERVESALPDNHAFLIISTPFAPSDPSQNVARYVANCQREEAIRMLKELLFRWGAGEEWMNHV